MGLDMFLFSIQKDKEKYLVDNKNSSTTGQLIFVDKDADGEEPPVLVLDTIVSSIFDDDFAMERTKHLQMGGKYSPYNLVIPGCNNPEQYHELLHHWRQSNAIHRWFVKNVQAGIDDKKWHRVSYKQLQKLKSVCEEVLKHSEIPNSAVLCNDEYYQQDMVDSSVAEKLLPTMDGFFFGSAEYNGYYIESLKETIKCLDRVLNNVDFDKVTVFYNSWS